MITRRSRSTPAAAKASRLCSVGTQTSSARLQPSTHPAGMRSVSNMVRSTRRELGASKTACGGKVCSTWASIRSRSVSQRAPSRARSAGVRALRGFQSRGSVLTRAPSSESPRTKARPPAA